MSKRFPWFRVYAEIVDDVKLADLTGDEFRLWIYLLGIASDNEIERGSVTGGASSIAWRTRNDESFVVAALDKFEDKGMIRQTQGRVVVVNFEKRQYDNPSDTPEAQRSRRDRRKRKIDALSAVDRPVIDTEGEGDREEDKKQPSVTTPPAADGFEVFWKAYPRKVGKQQAARLFSNLNKTDQAAAVEAAKHYAAACVDKDPKFIKQAPTFLSVANAPWREWVTGSPEATGAASVSRDPAACQWNATNEACNRPATARVGDRRYCAAHAAQKSLYSGLPAMELAS